MEWEIDWRSECEMAATGARRSCGLVYELYVERFSEVIDGLLLSLPVALQERARAIASEWGYESVSRRAAAQQVAAEHGFCSHFLDPYNCPVGCGDSDSFEANG